MTDERVLKHSKSQAFGITEADRVEFAKAFANTVDGELKCAFACSLKGKSSVKGKLFIADDHICFFAPKKGPFKSSPLKVWDRDAALDSSRSADDPLKVTLLTIIGFNQSTQHLQTKLYAIVAQSHEEADRIHIAIQRHLFGNRGTTALHLAVEDRDIARIDAIVGADPLKLLNEDRSDQSPLNLALMNNEVEVIRVLLDLYQTHNVDINTPHARSKNTILHTACSISNISDEILTMLLQYKSIDATARNADNNTPMHYFCEHNHSLNCKKLGALLLDGVQDPQDYLAIKNRVHETAVHKAVFNNKVRVFMIEMLIRSKATLNVFNLSGETPLHYAVHKFRFDLTELMLRAGADPTIMSSSGKTARDLALQYAEEQKNNADIHAIVDVLKNEADLREMLERVGMLEYAPKFIGQGLYDPVALSQLAKEDLATMEIDLKIGTEIKFFKEISNLANKLAEERRLAEEEKEKARKLKAMLPPDDVADELADPHKLRQELGIVEGEWEIDGQDLEFTKKLGSGASGQVYRGLFKGKEVAIKVLTAVDTSDKLDEFKKEFLIMTNVISPYMVTFYGASITPKLTMVMEYCQRGSLYHVLNTKSLDINWDQAFLFASDMASGMEVLHRFNPPIFHRDLKSLNLLVTHDWHTKVCDFGLSRMKSSDNLDTLKKMCGTFAYCAPEVFSGQTFSDRSDVYSMGIVLWEIFFRTINGRYEQPFGEYKFVYDFQIMVKTSEGVRPTIPEALPEPIKALIRQCILADVDKRPTTSEVAAELKRLTGVFNAEREQWDALLPFKK